MKDDDRRPTTTDAGIPVSSDEFSLTVGPDGPILLQDHYLIEQMANFNRERISERQPHARLFSYADAHRARLGVNYKQIPVNRPKCPVHSYSKDGVMRVENVTDPVLERALEYWRNIDKEIGDRIAKGVTGG